MSTSAWRARVKAGLLAALVLVASLGGAAHAHTTLSREAALRAESHPAALAAGELDCALCASSARVAHGAAPAALSCERLALEAPVLAGAGARPLPTVDLDPAEARAPPRNG